MKIFYFSPFDVLRARTNQISDVRLCEGFAENGCEVELLVPYFYRQDNMKRNEVFRFYGVKTPYKIKILKTFFWDGIPAYISLPVMYLYSALNFLKILRRNYRSLKEVIILSRDIHLLIPCILLKKFFGLRKVPKIISWVHDVIFSKKYYLWVYKNTDGIVGTNSAITEDVSGKLNIPRNKFAVSLNPITENQLQNVMGRKEARKRLNLNGDKPLVVYTGKLGIDWKEIKYIMQAAERLPQYHFLLTGGKPEAVDYYKRWCQKRKIQNVSFTGFLYNYDDVRLYQFAADALVSYYSPKEHLVRYNLPNKICEYMLTRSPIVTCDFPATKNILDSSNAIFVKPESPEDLAEKIREAVEDREKSKRLADQAFKDVQEITFKNRTKKLLNFFESL